MKNNLLHNAPLHYPSAREWMWDYCIYLGPFTNSGGYKYDLGIHIEEDINSICTANVCGHTPGDYYSADLPDYIRRSAEDDYQIGRIHHEQYAEVLKRAMACGLCDENGYKLKISNSKLDKNLDTKSTF